MVFGFLGFVLGIIFIFIGGFLVFFFPATQEFQNPGLGGWDMTLGGIVIGLVFLFIGIVLVIF